ncbi:hypothetical protein [Kribbella italica]|uniref:Uncharacterized protein n=1 Tax=Kribbella italica TaxID=1540520 RepID=A0A7W9MTD9_9ACTN|nr:hypothetical protein [Kribbella italica]MBB5835574.1 hypothetical protein [Kribbella italica]
MAVDRHHPKPLPEPANPELVAIVRIILVVGFLALLLGVLNHFV